MIVKQKWFTYETSISNPSKAIIVPTDYEKFPFDTREGGSYAVAPARVLGLSYPNYLRFLLTMFPDEVEIIGKNRLYPVVYWERGHILNLFLKVLNGKLSLALGLSEQDE